MRARLPSNLKKGARPLTFRFLHAADLHLDTPFTGLGRKMPRRVLEAVRDASLGALDALVETALEERVELVLLAGDVYDGAERGLRAQMRLQRAASRLSEAGITTCMVHGNHDPVDEGWSAIEHWPERFHVLGSERVETVSLTARDGVPVAVHGISYPRREVVENLAARFPRVSDGRFHVALLHANVGGQPGHERYSPCSLDDLRGAGHRYWALGHVHTRALLHEDPWIAYPGNLCGRGFHEEGPRGALLVEVADGAVNPSLVPLDPVRFLRLPFDIAEAAGVAGLTSQLAERGEALRSEHPGRNLCVLIELTGQGPAADALLRDGARDDVLKELRDAQDDPVHFLWWAGIELDVQPELDLAALRGGEDLASVLVEMAGQLEHHDARRVELLDELLEKIPARHRVVEASPELVRAALIDALHRLRSNAR